MVERLISGTTFFRSEGKIYKLVRPTAEIRTLACFLADEAADELNFSQLVTDEKLAEVLDRRGIWTYQNDADLKVSQEAIEDMQIAVYKNFFNTKSKKAAKNRLAGIRKVIEEALSRRATFFHSTLESYHSFIRDRFVAAMSLYDINNNKVYDAATIFSQSSHMLDKAYSGYMSQYMISPHIREFARQGIWKSYWDSSGGVNVFGGSPADMTVFQRHLILYSKMYDNARQGMETPPDEVFEDDDAFDGWMAVQRKENEKKRAQKNADAITGQKGDEIFMVSSQEDSDKIYNLNDHSNKMKIKNRLKEVKSKGGEEIREDQLTDVKMKLRKELVEMVTGNRKG